MIEAFSTSPGLWLAVAALLGLTIGSFLNVVIHRLPRMMEREWQSQCAELRGETPVSRPTCSLMWPRSACPKCDHAIAWYENIPLLSYFLLRGKCAGCGVRISPMYPVVELLAGVLATVIAWKFGFTWPAAAALVFAWALIALAFIDLNTQYLPDDITLPLLWLGLLCNLQGWFAPLDEAVVGAVAGYMTLWLVYHLFRWLTGKEGMGFGDFKLLAALGAWFGWTLLPLIILLSSLIGAAIGIGMIVLGGHDRARPIPFGPYLVLAGLVALLWGQALMRFYLG